MLKNVFAVFSKEKISAAVIINLLLYVNILAFLGRNLSEVK
jgi:hypothetical protein